MTTSSTGSSLLAVFVFLHDNARTRYGEFKAFAAHGFDQNGKLQFAAAGNVEGVLVVCFLDFQGHIALGFLVEAVTDDTACDLVALGARKR